MGIQNTTTPNSGESPNLEPKRFIDINRLIRIDEVSKLTSLALSTINLWVAQGKFVRPITLSPTIKVWKLQDVMNWIDSKTTCSNQNNPKLGEHKS